MKKFERKRRKPLRLESLEIRRLLVAPVAMDDSYSTDEDTPLNLQPQTENLIPRGAVWSYLDDGSDQGTAWKELDFDAETWSEGAAQLGYGDGDEVTVVGFGGDPNNKFATTYFRTEFPISDDLDTDGLIVRLQRDDGAAVYLNGVEVIRDNLVEDATFNVFANSSTGIEGSFTNFTVDAGLLVDGVNVLAVEVHQADGGSSDLSFDLVLDALLPTDGVLSNDFDEDGDPLVAFVSSEPEHGSLRLNQDGTFLYLPDADYHGADQFRYVVADGVSLSEEAVVSIDINSVNDAPIAAGDQYHALVDTPLDVDVSIGVLSNDVDADQDEMIAVLDTDVSNGTLILAEDGSFDYTPNSGFVGADSFSYRAEDGSESTEAILVPIVVTAENSPPVIGEDELFVDEDDVLEITLPEAPKPNQVFYTDFDNGVPPEFSGITTLDDVERFDGLGNEGSVFSGQFLRNESNPIGNGDPAEFTTLTLTGLPAHDSIDIGFLLGLVNGWDGTDNSFFAPDFFAVFVDSQLVLAESFHSWNLDAQTYQAPAGGLLAVAEDLWQTNDDLEAAYDLSLEPSLKQIPHSSANLTVQWLAGAEGYRRRFFGQFRDGESWAIDNVSIVLNQGSVGVVSQEQMVLPGSEWRYLDDGSDQGTAWREPGFDDSNWSAGAAQLGYGDGDEATELGFGPDAGNKFATTYFRHTFTANSVNRVTGLLLNLLRDDGVAVYLNGVEVVRDNLVGNAQFDDFAINDAQSESTFFNFGILPELLVNGENTLAVEIHQSGATSSDISFDLGLTAFVNEGAGNDLGVLSNDTDPDGGPLSAELLTQPTHGTLEFEADGTLTYTPEADYFGTDSFTYQAVDVHDGRSTGTVSITVLPGPNEPPLVADTTYQTDEDTILNVLADAGLLAAAADEDNDPLVAIVATPPAHGVVEVGEDGSFQYTPDPDFNGTDVFTYVVSDGQAASLPATATIEVASILDAPRASIDQYFIEPGDSLTVSEAAGVLGNDLEVDGQSLTAILVEDVNNGTLNLMEDGSFTYVPQDGFHATDSFKYQAYDGEERSAETIVFLTVDAQPVGEDDSYEVTEDVILTVNVADGLLSNDTDGESDPLTAVLVDQPQHGALTFSADGSFQYTPDEHYFGTDSFSYRADDGDQQSDATSVVISINAINDGPSAVADKYEIVQAVVLTVDATSGLLANDLDVDGPPLSVSLLAGSEPEHGVLELQPDGSFTYTPTQDYIGSDGFSYIVTDGLIASTADVKLSVTDPAEDVVISEIMYHAASENDAEEFIELHNAGLGVADLSGWRISKGVDFTVPAGITLGAGEYLVIAADTATFTATHGAVDNLTGGWTGRLSNAGEEIEVETATGDRVDRVTYADGGDWALRRVGPNDRGNRGWVWVAEHDGGGSSLELINSEASNRRGQNWASSLVFGGTPGVENSVASDSSAPLIYDVRHRPALPTHKDVVTVTADLSDDEDAPLTAEVMYRVSTFFQNEFLSAPMYDDGLHGDGDAHDGEFGGFLPTNPDGTIVEFYVRAMDEEGLSRTWPAPTDAQGNQGANASYQVVSDAYDGEQPIYRIVLTVQDEQELLNINRQSDAQINATFINVDGTGADVRYNTGVRIRGSGSRTRTPPNYRVNIPSDNPWQGVDAINLNTQYPHGQLLGMTLFELAGLAQEDGTAVQIRVNGTQTATTPVQQGSYVRLEVTNSQWVENHYPNDSTGNFYRGNSAVLNYQGPNPDSYRNGYSKSTNSSQDDWSDLIALTAALSFSETPNDVFMETLEQVADVDQWMRFLAINALLVNEENGLINGNGDDYSLYCGVVDPRCRLVPHDMDTIFGEGDGSANTAEVTRDLFEPTNTPAFNRILGVPEYLEMYFSHLRDLATTVFSDEQLYPLMDNLLGDWVNPAIINQMKEFASARVAWVLNEIPASSNVLPVATIQENLPAVSPSTQATFTVGGEGVIRYRYRLDDGRLWVITPAVRPIVLRNLTDGEHQLAVFGINLAGDMQEIPTLSKTWIVDSGYSNVVINEVMASNNSVEHEGTFPDMIELFNRGTEPIDLTGMTITDDVDSPDSYAFPAGTMLDGGQYLVLYADSDNTTSGPHLGFSLDNGGEGVYLFDSEANGGELLDQVEFGMQLDDLSLGRGPEFGLVLSQPTFGAENVAQPLGDPSGVRINEWLASGDRFTQDDFFELYNPDPLPVNIGEYYLTDTPVGWPDRHQIAPFSFIEGSGFRAFVADDNESAGEDHVNFDLNANRESIAIYDDQLDLIDMVIVMPQTTDVSEGRSPDGSGEFAFFGLPSPGASNMANPTADRLLSSLRITELMYNPPGDDDTEFVELQNVGDLPLDITGVRLRGGIDFEFPAMQLQPGEYVVVANDLAAFTEQYGEAVHVAGEYTGKLDNGGEEISVRLAAPLDIDIQRFDYNDNPNRGWPAEADGDGPSLVIVDPNGDYNDGPNWQVSVIDGGTPGRDENVVFLEVVNVRINVGMIDPPDLPGEGAQPTSWEEQRDTLTTIQVTFSGDVELDVNDVLMTNLGVNAPADVDVTVPLLDDHLSVAGNVLTITFAHGELPDGIFRLEVLPTVVSESGPLDGNRDGTAGDAYVLVGNGINGLFQLTGDWNGDQGTTIFDFPAFAYWYGEVVGNAPAYVDLNNDQGITIFDFPVFVRNFGTQLVAPTPLVSNSTLLNVADTPQELGPKTDEDPIGKEVEVRRLSPTLAHEKLFSQWTSDRRQSSDMDDTDLLDLEEVLDMLGSEAHQLRRR